MVMVMVMVMLALMLMLLVVVWDVVCGMWWEGTAGRASHSKASLTRAFSVWWGSASFLARPCTIHTHTCAPTTLSRAVAAATLLESATVALSVSLDESSIIEPSIDQPL